MAITPTSTIVASPQAGLSRYFFWQIGNDLQINWEVSNAGIFENGADKYTVLFHCTNFGQLSENQTWQLSVFKNGTVQDASNEPLIINPHTDPTKQYNQNICPVQIGTDLYLIYWSRAGLLAMKVFHMATDLYGSVFTSALTPGTPPTRASAGGGGAAGLSAAYNASTDKIVIVHNGFSINYSSQDWQRPAFVDYEVTANTWGTWTIIGHDSSIGDFAESVYGACLDCRGAVDLCILAMNPSDVSGVSTIYFQSIFSGLTTSSVQSTGATATGAPGNCNPASYRPICTGAEVIIPYSPVRFASSVFRDGLSVTRATLPSTDTLPSSWTLEAVHTVATGSFIAVCGVASARVGATVVLIYSGLNSGNGIQIACAVWDGSWTDDDTLLAALTVYMARGTLESTYAIITYDFTANVGDISGDNTKGGLGNEIFGLVSLLEPVCSSNEGTENLGFSDSGSANKIPGPGPNPPPIPGPAPTRCIPSAVFAGDE